LSTLALTLAPPRSRSLSRVAFEVACAVAGSFLLAGLAQLSFKLPFTPVPITGQTLGVLLLGAAYGPALGAATILLYLVWAVVGLPVLAPNLDGSHATGLAVLQIGFATGGFLWGFVVAAGLTGWLAQRRWDRSFGSSIGAMLLGSVVVYAFGIPWLMASLHLPLAKGLELGLYPFVIGDMLKLLAAAGLLPAAWALLRRLRPGEGS
jgi:biotin transport system substrate-specific component